jgi:hypothetical protein
LIPAERVCEAARVMEGFESVQGDKASLDPLFNSVGLTPDVLKHTGEHGALLGIFSGENSRDPLYFALGMLWMGLMLNHSPEELSDSDLTELLRDDRGSA